MEAQGLSLASHEFILHLKGFTELLVSLNKVMLKLYIKNARECSTMISKHEKAYEALGAKPRELFIALSCFDIMVKHSRACLI